MSWDTVLCAAIVSASAMNNDILHKGYSECDYRSEIGSDVSRVVKDEKKLIELGS